MKLRRTTDHNDIAQRGLSSIQAGLDDLAVAAEQAKQVSEDHDALAGAHLKRAADTHADSVRHTRLYLDVAQHLPTESK